MSTTPLTCPNCGAAMATEAQGPVTVDRCPACHTLWFDRTELAAVVAQEVPGATVGFGAPVEQGAAAPQTCPRDGTPTLREFALRGIRFRRCSTCRGVAIGATDYEGLLAAVAANPGGPLGPLGQALQALFGGA